MPTDVIFENDENVETPDSLGSKNFQGTEGAENSGNAAQTRPKIIIKQDNFRCLNDLGKRTTAMILGEIKRSLPHISYCPILKPLVVLLLHYIDDDEKVFFYLTRLITLNVISGNNTQLTKPSNNFDKNLNSEIPKLRYFSQSEPEHFSDSDILYQLSLQHCSAFHSSGRGQMVKYKCFLSWLLECLPFYYSTLVLDSYLSEGFKIFYRYSLLLLKLYGRVIPPRNDTRHVLPVGVFASQLLGLSEVSPDYFKGKAFNIKRFSTEKIKVLYKSKNKGRKSSFQDIAKFNEFEDLTPKTQTNSNQNLANYLSDYIDFVPKTSEILSQMQFCRIYAYLPELNQVMFLKRLYGFWRVL